MGRTRGLPKPCRQCHLRGGEAPDKHMVYSILLSLGGALAMSDTARSSIKDSLLVFALYYCK